MKWIGWFIANLAALYSFCSMCVRFGIGLKFGTHLGAFRVPTVFFSSFKLINVKRGWNPNFQKEPRPYMLTESSCIYLVWAESVGFFQISLCITYQKCELPLPSKAHSLIQRMTTLVSSTQWYQHLTDALR